MSSDINDGYELLKRDKDPAANGGVHSQEQEPKRGEGMFMDEARQLAAQCWCDDETKDRVMDPALCEAVAKRISAWMDMAAQYARNQEFYQGIVTKIGETLGVAAKTSDDGTMQDDVLVLKVPELVADHAAKVAELEREIERLRTNWLSEQKQRLETADLVEMYSAVKAKHEIADLRKQLAEANGLQEKHRLAAVVMCGKHIGVPQGKCPVCELDEAKAEIEQGRKTHYRDLLEVSGDCGEAINESEKYESVLSAAAVRLTEAVPIGKVKNIGLMEVPHAIDELTKQLAAERAKRERIVMAIKSYLDGAQGSRHVLSKALADDAI